MFTWGSKDDNLLLRFIVCRSLLGATKFTFLKIKSRANFGEFIRFFPEGLNPFKIHRRFKYGNYSKIFSIICVGNLKSAQFRKLFITLQSSIMQNLGIFAAM
jgi:hypothetical protein